MTDRELLEYAAKAAGVGGGWQFVRGRDTPICYRDAGGREWNPLTDDGDALRLAVKLGLLCGFVQPNCWAELPGQYPSYEPYEPDPYAATRRAIVRAAAEIGRKL